MPTIYECLETHSNVTKLEILNNDQIALCTKDSEVVFFSYKDCKILNELNNITDTFTFAFSKNGKLLATAKNSTLNIIDIKSNNITTTIDTNEDIELLEFDISSTYVIAGTKSGRVLQYRYNSPSLLSRICSFPYDKSKTIFIKTQNYVSCFAFYKHLIACSGYGGAIYIIDIYSRTNKDVLTYTSVRTNAICFLDENNIISANIDGKIYITSLKDKTTNIVDTHFTNIKQLVVMPNPNYIMVCWDSNELSIVDIVKFKVIHSKYIEFKSKINAIALIDEETMLVALDNSKVLKILLPNIQKLKSFIFHNSLDEAYRLIEKDPMLRESKESDQLEQKYLKIYENAVQALIDNNKEYARQMTDMLLNTNTKKQEIKLLFQAFENYARFKELHIERKYALVYAMSDKFPALKYTDEYKNIEKLFRDKFVQAQNEIFRNNIANAKSLLSEFITVNSKRSLLQLLFNKNREFMEFLAALEKNDFQKVRILSQKNEIFKQIPTLSELNTETKHILDHIQDYINRGEIEKAVRKLNRLSSSLSLNEKISQLTDEYSNVSKLQKAYKAKDIKSCYEILDQHDHLCSTELGKKLENNWRELMDKCEELSLNGDTKAIRDTLQELLYISSRSNKTGDLLRVSFHVKIDKLIEENRFKIAEKAIYSYIDMFGSDIEMTNIMKRFNSKSSLQIAITQGKRPKRDSWMYL